MTFRCAVLGNPIAHSRSPQIHAAFAQKYGINLCYERILVTADNLAATIEAFFIQGGRGLNITAPHKIAAYMLANKATAYAQAAQAANTLWYENHTLYADNTDGAGFIHALKNVHHYSFADKRILILGAGGAVRGLLLPLLQEPIAALDIQNRTLAKAQALIETHRKTQNIALHAYDFHAPSPQKYDLIINATSTTDLPLQNHWIADAERTFCYELAYGAPSSFLAWANARCHCADGESMLHSQAWLSFQRFFAPELASFQ